MEKILICFFFKDREIELWVSRKRETPSDVISPKLSSLIYLSIGKYGQCMQSSLCGLGFRNIFGTGRDEEAMCKIRIDERLRGRLLEDNFHLNRTEYYFSRGKPVFFFFFQWNKICLCWWNFKIIFSSIHGQEDNFHLNRIECHSNVI